MNVFLPADILLPVCADMGKWAVIACDQFTSNPAYWENVERTVGNAPSTYHMILPEARLGSPEEAEYIRSINETMEACCRSEQLRCYDASFVYVERTLQSGRIRKGLVGMVDLDAYDYRPGAASPIRATEATVTERIPPRQKVRQGASLEFPHILMLVDDDKKQLLEPVEAAKDRLPLVYDFDLMADGGHIRGWLVSGSAAEAFNDRLSLYTEHCPEKYAGLPGTAPVFAVGDGNHSLATAKSCYEALKAAHPGEDLSDHPARFALVELENIHDDAQVFEPIHRVVMDTDPEALLKALEPWCAENGYPVQWIAGTERGTICLDPACSQLAVGVLQPFLDEFLKNNPGRLDYIHGSADTETLAAQPGAVGFLLPAMEKGQLFRGIMADGVLPRKTFSMGHACEKRYYLEGRKIK